MLFLLVAIVFSRLFLAGFGVATESMLVDGPVAATKKDVSANISYLTNGWGATLLSGSVPIISPTTRENMPSGEFGATQFGMAGLMANSSPCDIIMKY